MSFDRQHPPREIRYRGAPIDFDLRPWSVEDVDAQVALANASLPELRAFMPWSHRSITRQTQYEWMRRFEASYWAGTDYTLGVFGTDGTLLGGTGMHPRTPLNPAALEVGYWCGTQHAGKGIMTAVVRCLVVVAFGAFGCDRFQVTHDTANAASRRVILKCGFREEGVMRRGIAAMPQQFVDQGYRGTGDAMLYAIVREDLPSLPWLDEVRASTQLVDPFGNVFAAALLPGATP